MDKEMICPKGQAGECDSDCRIGRPHEYNGGCLVSHPGACPACIPYEEPKTADELKICPKWRECKANSCKHITAHVGGVSCKLDTSGCPMCVPAIPSEHEYKTSFCGA